MGFRFRRSIKLLPGIRLNFGKRGISTSISVEQTENALILFYVAAIFSVVTWNADRLHQRALLTPDTGADDCGSRRQLAGASQFSKLDTHAVERPIKLGNVASSAIVGSDRKDAEHIGFSAIGGADFAVHL